MKLYYAPGACSLSPPIVLLEAGAKFDLAKVEFPSKKTSDGEDFLAINPKGVVPTLRLDDGDVLTEGAVIVQYIADQAGNTTLAPVPGTKERLKVQEFSHSCTFNRSFVPGAGASVVLPAWSAMYCTMTAPSVSTSPSSSRSVGTAPLGLIARKSSPSLVFLEGNSTLARSNLAPASSRTMGGDSEQAPGA